MARSEFTFTLTQMRISRTVCDDAPSVLLRYNADPPPRTYSFKVLRLLVVCVCCPDAQRPRRPDTFCRQYELWIKMLLPAIGLILECQQCRQPIMPTLQTQY
jgi:hypothetical protein